MKKILLTSLLAVGAAAGLYAQGTVAFENYDGGGLVMQNGVGYAGTYTVALYGGTLGSSFAQLTLLSTFQVLSTAGNTPGNFFSGVEPSITGVAPGSSATLVVQGWDGTFANYAAAVAAGGTENVGQTATFSNPTGHTGSPPSPGAFLTGMPTLTLAPIPEPTTIALGGLGALSLLLFRRRK